MAKDRFVHKHGYGYLFSDRTLVRELLESFVNREFAAQIDFNDFTPLIEKSYITEDFRDFAEDLLVKIKLSGKEAYIYLLIEFQSSSDRFMSLRLLNYVVLFYLDYLKEHPNTKRLPPVFPLVLYNGRERWNAPDNIRDLIEPHEFCREFYPDFRYFKIVEQDYSREKLLEINNAVAGIFLLENSTRQDFGRVSEELKEIVAEESAHTIALLAEWIKHLVRNERFDAAVFEEITRIKNEQEARSMLVQTIEEVKQDWYEEGMQQGMQQKAREDAIRMLRRKFSIADTADITGLSVQEIEKIKTDTGNGN